MWVRVRNEQSGQGRHPGQSLGQRGRASGTRKGPCFGSLAPERDGAGEWGASGQTLQKVERQVRPVRGLEPSHLSLWEQGPGVQGHHLFQSVRGQLERQEALSQTKQQERRWIAALVKG